MQKQLPIITLFLLYLLVFSWAGSERAEALEPALQPDEAIRSEELTFHGFDFANGGGDNVVVGGDGVTLAQGTATATYTSPPLDAPLAFNALVPQWRTPQSETALQDGQAGLPLEHEHERLRFQFRTAKEGRWNEWLDI